MTTVASASASRRAVAVDLDQRYSYVAEATPVASYVIEMQPGFELAIELSGETWTVRDMETGIFGSGPAASDAIADFFRAVEEHRDVLERQPSLSDELAAQLAYLRSRIT